MALPKLITVVGPTASGKTDLGIALARAFDGEVICADSRTVYREMDVGTAKPAPRTSLLEAGFSPQSWGESEGGCVLEGIAHWGINLIDPDATYTASDFQNYADQKIAEIIRRGRQPILVGGTGLYVRAVLDRPTFAEVPPDPNFRIEVATLSDEQLLEEIAERDPDAALGLDIHNRRRLERALEILRATGTPLKESRGWEKPKYDPLIIGVDVDREELYTRIDARVDAMVAAGLVDEVRRLLEKYGPDAPGLTGIGYREIAGYLTASDTYGSLREAIVDIKTNTRHYARRQMTWFRRDNRIHWVKSAQEAVAKVQAWLA